MRRHPFNEVMGLLTDNELRRIPRRAHRLAQDTYSATDCEFFLTLCAREAGTPFRDQELAKSVIGSLLWRRERHQWRLYCYCLMPDHLHLVLRLPEQDVRWINGGALGPLQVGVIQQLGDFKRYTTNKIWRPSGGVGPLWQRSSYDRVIRYGDSIDAVMDYVLENPVRKGLVDHWQEYPFAGCVDE